MSSRIISIILKGIYGYVKVIQVYVPDSTRDEKEIDSCYEHLGQGIGPTREQKQLYVMSDFSKRKGTQRSEHDDTTGYFVIDDRSKKAVNAPFLFSNTTQRSVP